MGLLQMFFYINVDVAAKQEMTSGADFLCK